MATAAVMSPSVGVQRRIYSGEATREALFDLVYYDKIKKAEKPVEWNVLERPLEPFNFFGSIPSVPVTTTPAKPAFVTTEHMSGSDKRKSKIDKQGVISKMPRSAGRQIAAARPSSMTGKTPKKTAVAGSTATALAPAPQALPFPPTSLLA